MALDTNALDALLEVIGGDRTSLVELIESFEGEAPRLLEAMQVAQANAKPDEMRRAAHTMKSSARDFGAVDLSLLCERLEHSCRDGDLAPVPGLLAAIAPAYSLAMADLAAFKASCRDG
jgi:histidine phosphotransfer protein HptB